MTQKHCVYIFFAPPGSGKTTQNKMLFEHLKELKSNPISINVGSLVREHFANPKTNIEELFKEKMENGELLPPAVPISLWTEEILEKYENGTTMILDGVARTKNEASLLIDFLRFLKTCVCIFYLSVPKTHTIERLKKRGRVDDNTVKIIEKRFKEYNKKTKKALRLFKKTKGIFKYYKIDGTGTPEEVAERVNKHISKINNKL